MSGNSWRTLFTGCCRSPDDSHRISKKLASQQSSLRRVSSSESGSRLSLAFSLEDISFSLAGSNLYVFTLAELQMVTGGFCNSNFLGEGGFGPVYKGLLDERIRPGMEAQAVAVKLLDLDGGQGDREWLAEVIVLGKLRHPHLVRLIGYCYENQHRLLVYEYMSKGNLENHLFQKFFASLPWLTRMKIAVEAAKGLAFLHDTDRPVIYRDFKASNILLDLDYTAKLSDFGLAKDGPEGDNTHVSTRVMGTQGYAAPEYIMTGHLTAKSDVYSFGVVLLELLTGRRSVDRKRPSREQNLVEWARPCLNDTRKLSRIMDPSLDGIYSTKAAEKAAALAYQCLGQSPKSRPQMSSIVEILEPLLDLNDGMIGSFVFTVVSENGGVEMKDAKANRNGQNERRQRIPSAKSRDSSARSEHRNVARRQNENGIKEMEDMKRK